MQQVIINADDFGLSYGVSRAINELFEINAITSTSMMIAAPSAIKIIKESGAKELLGFAGVHLQLTQGKPLSKENEVRTLIDGSGKFLDPRKRTDYNLNEVYKEWKNQIETAIELLGGLPTHLDSHHGVHRISGIFEVYIRLASEYNLPVRGFNAIPLSEEILEKKINASISLVRNWTGKGLSSLELIKECNEISIHFPNEKYIEVISHPGYSDNYLESISSLNKAREIDFYVLRDMTLSHQWESNGFILTNYLNIENGKFRSC